MWCPAEPAGGCPGRGIVKAWAGGCLATLCLQQPDQGCRLPDTGSWHIINAWAGGCWTGLSLHWLRGAGLQGRSCPGTMSGRPGMHRALRWALVGTLVGEQCSSGTPMQLAYL